VRELFQAKKNMRDYPLFRSIYAWDMASFAISSMA
jgi:hypothetical protein